MQLTQRDIEIIQFINTFGFCEIRHIEQRFQLHRARAYQVLQRLIKQHYLCYQRIFHKQNGAFRVTDKGAELSDLPALQRIPVAQYQHDLTIIDVFLKLIKRYPDLHWVSERHVRYEKYAGGIPKRGDHILDGKIIFPDGKHVAIEVELTLKNKNRLAKILKGYSAEFSIHEVWYFCPPPIANVIQTLASTLPLIKVFNLPEC